MTNQGQWVESVVCCIISRMTCYQEVVCPESISIYTSTSPFSLEGEGWDEGDINGCFYSPRQLLPALLYLLHPCSRHPNPLQQERELGCFVTLCICNEKSCVDTYAFGEGKLSLMRSTKKVSGLGCGWAILYFNRWKFRPVAATG